MAWIEYHTDLRDHWKIHEVKKALKIPYAHALGLVSCLWLWAAGRAPNGNLKKFPNHILLDAMKWEGEPFEVRPVLIDSCLLDSSGKLHDWGKHGIRLLVSSRKRVEKFRKNGGGDAEKWTAIRVDILRRDGYICRYCRRKATCVDHVIPTTKGGKNDYSNLVASCKACNLSKNNRTPEEAGMKILDVESNSSVTLQKRSSLSLSFPSFSLSNHSVFPLQGSEPPLGKDQTAEKLRDLETLAEHVDATFEKLKKAPYPFRPGDDGKTETGPDIQVLGWALGNYSLFQAMGLWDLFLEEKGEWIEKVGHTLTEFQRQVPMLLGKGWQSRAARYEPKGAPPIAPKMKTPAEA